MLCCVAIDYRVLVLRDGRLFGRMEMGVANPVVTTITNQIDSNRHLVSILTQKSIYTIPYNLIIRTQKLREKRTAATDFFGELFRDENRRFSGGICEFTTNILWTRPLKSTECCCGRKPSLRGLCCAEYART